MRLLNAEREMAELPKYDYLIINREGQVAESVEQLKAILMAEHVAFNNVGRSVADIARAASRASTSAIWRDERRRTVDMMEASRGW